MSPDRKTASKRFNRFSSVATGIFITGLALISNDQKETSNIEHTQVNEPPSLNQMFMTPDEEILWTSPPPKPPAVEAPKPPPTVYWIFAHPDDETLAAAAAIMQSEADGNRNVVVIISSGENTVVRNWYGLTRQQTSTARQEESKAGLSFIELEDVRYLGIPEGQIGKDFVRDLIRGLISETQGDAIFRGHSPYDSYVGLRCGHPDHCVIGQALVDAWRDEEIKDLRLYRISHLMGGAYGEKCDNLNSSQWTTKQNMRREYARIDKKVGRYGIAGQSVPGAWYQTARQPECYDLPK